MKVFSEGDLVVARTADEFNGTRGRVANTFTRHLDARCSRVAECTHWYYVVQHGPTRKDRLDFAQAELERDLSPEAVEQWLKT